MATIKKNASLVLEDLTLDAIYSQPNDGCIQPAISAAAGANFSAVRTKWNDIWNDSETFLGSVFNGAIGSQGDDSSGNLTVEDSLFNDIDNSGVISWNGQDGSVVNIVSSRFDFAGGISVSGAATSNIVNSIWSDFGTKPGLDDRIVNFSSGEMNIIASTLLFASVICDESCQEGDSPEGAGSRGRVLREEGGAQINLIQSAIGVTFPDQGPAYTLLLDPRSALDSTQGFSADTVTWIQPTALQDAGALQDVTFQPNLLTEAPGLPTAPVDSPDQLFNQATRATPIVPGQLIDRIENAACTQANELLNPIDGTCITEDALGNPRVDGNEKRNIGAVQLNEAPHLSVAGVGDQPVDLIWTKPIDLIGDFTGYVLFYRETGAANFTEILIPGDADTLTYQVTGLTNGTEYEFRVDSYVDNAPGRYLSNRVTATPISGAVLDCTTAEPSSDRLWPPNHRLVSIDVLGITDDAGSPITVSIDGVFQDEPVNGKGDGNTSPDAEGIGTSTASVRAEREGNGNGRVYTVFFTAWNDGGAQCNGSVTVGVPKSRKRDAVNDGPLFDSTKP